VKLAVTAYIRHNMTDYDDLLDQGIDRDEARKMVIYRTNEILSEWESDDGDDPA